LGNRSRDIHWPTGFDPAKADLFAHNELVIHAPCERVWHHIIDATKWPEWVTPNAKAVQIMNGTVLGQGSVFRWTTFGLSIESKVNEFCSLHAESVGMATRPAPTRPSIIRGF